MNKIRLLFFVLIGMSSCQKVIDLKVNNTTPKLVIEAKYNAVEEKVTVNVTKTTDIYSTNDFPTIDNATISIVDKNGVETALIHQGNGEYKLTNYSPIFNGKYTVKVKIDGTTYSASDTLQPIVNLDSLSTKYQEESLFFEGGYIAFLHFKDPSTKNYYRVKQTVNGEYQSDLGDQFIFDDDMSNGESVEIPIYWRVYEPNDTIQLKLITYSEQNYIYHNELFVAVSGSQMTTAPANPTNRWSPNCLGNFSAFGYDVDTIVVKK